MKRDNNSDRLSLYLAEFCNRQLEREYFYHEMRDALRYIKPLCIVLGVLYLLFFIPDYIFMKDSPNLKIIFIDRVSFFILIIFLYIKLHKLKRLHILSYCFTIYELLLFVSFMIIAFVYESPTFLLLCFSLIIIILAIFTIPNRWIFMVITSLFISFSFFMLSPIFIENIDFLHFSASIIYILIAIVICSFSSYIINFHKRMQYIVERKLEKLSSTDHLTEICNRLKFDTELDKWIRYSIRYKSDLSLILFDIDHFKIINDQYGHLQGDKVIIDIVNIVNRYIRDTDVFARWGGEEFVVLLPGTNIIEAEELATFLRKKIAKHNFSRVPKVTCSFGVVSLEKDDDKISFIARADKLLYAAKEAGRNTVMTQFMLENLQIHELEQ